MIGFTEDSHSYFSLIPDGRKWTSVTSLIKKFEWEFDAMKMSESTSIKEDSKWYGLEPAIIRSIWDQEKERSVKLGKWYHQKQEAALCCKNQCPIIDGVKHALPQKLTDGIYPEFMLYHPEHNICGQTDYIEVKDKKLVIKDYKTSKIIKAEAWKGKTLKYPLNNIEDCELNIYTLQMSLYAYMILYHNPTLMIDKMSIEHIKFEVKEYDSYGYPVMQLDGNGDYIVKEVISIPVPYLWRDVNNLLAYVKNNGEKLQAVIGR